MVEGEIWTPQVVFWGVNLKPKTPYSCNRFLLCSSGCLPGPPASATRVQGFQASLPQPAPLIPTRVTWAAFFVVAVDWFCSVMAGITLCVIWFLKALSPVFWHSIWSDLDSVRAHCAHLRSMWVWCSWVAALLPFAFCLRSFVVSKAPSVCFSGELSVVFFFFFYLAWALYILKTLVYHMSCNFFSGLNLFIKLGRLFFFRQGLFVVQDGLEFTIFFPLPLFFFF